MRDSPRFDVVSLGEVMLRLDPGDVPVRSARNFRACEGGGEYNVARASRKVFGRPSAILTALVDNEIGRLVEDLVWQGGVDTSYVSWVPFDGTGKAARNGLNFTERGFGVRSARGCSDRAGTAASQLGPGAFDLDRLFQHDGVRWVHTGGIFAALGEHTADLIIEVVTAARATGAIASYDLNYRESLWTSLGGNARAEQMNRRIIENVDVLIGNEEDFSAALGFEVLGVSDDFTALDPAAFGIMIEQVIAAFPHLRAVGTTLRDVHSASRNGWNAVLWTDGALFEATPRPDLEIYDRVGGGDAFASGLIHAFLSGKTPQECVELGAAHGALAMTTPGDTSMAILDEVLRLTKGAAARVVR